MSNLRQASARLNNLIEPEDERDTANEKSRRLSDALDDIYENASFKDTVIQNNAPGINSMNDGETRVAKIDGEFRQYRRIGSKLLYSVLTEA